MWMYILLPVFKCRTPFWILEVGCLMCPPCSFQVLKTDHLPKENHRLHSLGFSLGWPHCSPLGHNYTVFAVLSSKLLWTEFCVTSQGLNWFKWNVWVKLCEPFQVYRKKEIKSSQGKHWETCNWQEVLVLLSGHLYVLSFPVRFKSRSAVCKLRFLQGLSKNSCK